jgi:predicted dehydrogenase
VSPCRIRIGIVGAGFITNLSHLPNWKRFHEAEVVAICDTDKDRAAVTSSKFGIGKTYTDLQEMLDEERLDLVDVCTPPSTHAKVAELCLSTGHNCSIEKPLALATSEVDDMVRISRSQGVKIFVLHTYSYLPCVRKYKAIIKSGELGQIARVSTSYYANLGQERYTGKDHWIHSLPGGILSSEITPHLLMLVLELLDGFEEIRMTTNNSSPNRNGKQPEAEIVMVDKKGSLGTVGLSFNSRHGVHTADLLGTEGYVHADFNSQTSVLHKFRGNQTGTLDRGAWATSEITQRTTDLIRISMGTILGRYTPVSDGHRYLFSRIIENLNDNVEYPVSLDMSREVVRAMESVFSSEDSRMVNRV